MTRWISMSLLMLASSVSMANPCVLLSPVKLTPSELQQVEQKGYEVQVKRSLYEHQRFLGVYEYYEMKHPEKVVGQVFLNAVLSPRPIQANSFGPDVSMISKREFHFMASRPKFVSTIAFSSSTPIKFARSKDELESASFSSIPTCR